MSTSSTEGSEWRAATARKLDAEKNLSRLECAERVNTKYHTGFRKKGTITTHELFSLSLSAGTETGTGSDSYVFIFMWRNYRKFPASEPDTYVF